jgi:hypothetical protein
MQLLFRREQTAGTTGRVNFKLWAKIELEQTESSIVKHYRFDDAVLIDSFQPLLMRKTAMVAFGGFIVSLGLFASFAGLSFGMFLAALAGGGAGYFYWDRYRDTIYVRDLLHGRNFKCASVIELARKEAWLGTITAFLRQVMESARYWDGTEASEIPVLNRDDAKELIVRGL